MMTDGCLLGWVSDGKALSYSHFPLVRRQIRFFLPERYIVSLFHSPTVTVVNYWDTAKLMKCQPALSCQRACQMFSLCFSELNQLNEVLHGKCLVLHAELSVTFLQQNFQVTWGFISFRLLGILTVRFNLILPKDHNDTNSLSKNTHTEDKRCSILSKHILPPRSINPTWLSSSYNRKIKGKTK